MLIQSVLEIDYADAASSSRALEKLELGKQACEGDVVQPKVRAKLYIAIGTVLAGGQEEGRRGEGRVHRRAEGGPDGEALQRLHHARGAAGLQRRARRRARRAAARAETSEGGAAQRKPKKTYPGGGRLPRGWKQRRGLLLLHEAHASEASRDWLDCADYAQASLAAENRADDPLPRRVVRGARGPVDRGARRLPDRRRHRRQDRACTTSASRRRQRAADAAREDAEDRPPQARQGRPISS